MAPAWQPIFIENLQAARRIAIEGSYPPRTQSLADLASAYVSNCLRVDARSTPLFQLVSLAERDIPKPSAFDELQALLESCIPQHRDQINSLVNEIILQRMENQHRTDQENITNSETINTSTSTNHGLS